MQKLSQEGEVAVYADQLKPKGRKPKNNTAKTQTAGTAKTKPTGKAKAKPAGKAKAKPAGKAKAKQAGKAKAKPAGKAKAKAMPEQTSQATPNAADEATAPKKKAAKIQATAEIAEASEEHLEAAKKTSGTGGKRKSLDERQGPMKLTPILQKLFDDPQMKLPPADEFEGHFAAPEWVKGNNVYSASYKAYLAALPKAADVGEAQAMAKAYGRVATRVFRELRVIVPELMNGHQFMLVKRAPRAKRAKPDVDGEGVEAASAPAPEEPEAVDTCVDL